jgi:hypothetical protein
MALPPPPNSQIPNWVNQGNNPYNIPALQSFYNVFQQSPGFAMNMLQKMPGMNNLTMSAINGGPLDRNSLSNPAVNDFKNLMMHYAGGNAGSSTQGMIEGLGANPMNPLSNLAGGWTVAPGGMANLGNIRQWAGLLNAAANQNNSQAYNSLMANLPQGIKMINFNTQGLQGGNTGAGPNPYAPTQQTLGNLQQGVANTNQTQGQANNGIPSNYTGFGNSSIAANSTAPGGLMGQVGSYLQQGQQNQSNLSGLNGYNGNGTNGGTGTISQDSRGRIVNPGLYNGGFTPPPGSGGTTTNTTNPPPPTGGNTTATGVNAGIHANPSLYQNRA